MPPATTAPANKSVQWSVVEFIKAGLLSVWLFMIVFFFSSRRRHTRLQGDWSSDVCSSDLQQQRKQCTHRTIVFNRAVRALFPLLLCAAASAHAATVAIDVGHFIEEPGATSAHGRPELDFNRDLAVEIESAARRDGLKTMLIGYDGFMSQLARRAAAPAAADFLLSVHHDSVQPHFLETWDFDRVERAFSDRYSGFSLFVSRKNRSLARSLACASAIGEARLRASERFLRE